MLTSRLPHDRDEIKHCVFLLKHSPYWRGCTLTEEEVTDCWEKLHHSGFGWIDIIHETDHDQFLVQPSLAKQTPHFERGHGCIFFDCYVTHEVMQEIVMREDDSEDPMVYFLRLYNEHRLDPSKPCPVPSLGPKDAAPTNLNGLSLALFHPALDFRNQAVLDGSENFNKMVEASMKHACKGLRHDSWMNIIANETMVLLYEHFGNILLRPYHDNNERPEPEKKFIFFMCKDESVCRQFGIDTKFNYRNTKPIGIYLYLFNYEKRERKANLPRSLQRTCYLTWIGFSPVQIANFLKVRENTVRRQLDQARDTLRELDVDPLFRLDGEPVNQNWLLQAIDGHATYEIRQYLVPPYEWPKSLRSRRWY